MATTRQLVSHILENDAEIAKWFETNHRFTLQKARTAPLEDYQGLIGVIINEGVQKQVISKAQANGAEDL